eukprot:1016-Heterococcus_DN1.PRE.2
MHCCSSAVQLSVLSVQWVHVSTSSDSRVMLQSFSHWYFATADNDLLESLDLDQYKIKGSEAEWQKALKPGSAAQSVQIKGSKAATKLDGFDNGESGNDALERKRRKSNKDAASSSGGSSSSGKKKKSKH